MIQEFQNIDINLKGKTSGQIKTQCPQCSESRRNKKDPCLSVNIDSGVYHCHHCDFSGTVNKLDKELEKEYSKPENLGTPLKPNALKFFADRGISEDTINRFNITQSNKGIGFNYFLGGELINVKHRGPDKKFQLEKDCRLILYNMNSIYGKSECYITEGEMDALALYEAGFKSVVSVPNGAHVKNNNLKYLDSLIEEFDHLEKIIIMTDGDAPGVSLRNELARRFGKEKCFYVEYPEGCKDANDVLINHGKDVLSDVATSFKEFPLDGIATIHDFEDEIDFIFEHGFPSGESIGNELDEQIKWRGGEWTVVTGSPGCFVKDQLVHTNKGVLPISQIKEGDMVLSYNHSKKINEYRMVSRIPIHKNHRGKLYKITMKDGTIITVTDNHEFFTGTKYVKIKEILLSLDL